MLRRDAAGFAEQFVLIADVNDRGVDAAEYRVNPVQTRDPGFACLALGDIARDGQHLQAATLRLGKWHRMGVQPAACPLQADNLKLEDHALAVQHACFEGAIGFPLRGNHKLGELVSLYLLKTVRLDHGEPRGIHLHETSCRVHDLHALRFRLDDGAQARLACLQCCGPLIDQLLQMSVQHAPLQRHGNLVADAMQHLQFVLAEQAAAMAGQIHHPQRLAAPEPQRYGSMATQALRIALSLGKALALDDVGA